MANVKQIRSYKTKAEKDHRKRVSQAVRGMRDKMRVLAGAGELAEPDAGIVVKDVLWRNFLHANDTFVLIAAARFGVKFEKLKGTNMAMDQFCLVRLTPGGNIVTIHARSRGGLATALTDVGKVFREKITFAPGVKAIAKLEPEATRQMLATLREESDLHLASAFLGDLVVYIEEAARKAV